MIKRIVDSSDLDARYAQDQELLDQMRECLSTTKMLRQFCIDLRALADQLPAPHVQRLLDQIEAQYSVAVKDLMQLHRALIEPDPSSRDTAQGMQ